MNDFKLIIRFYKETIKREKKRNILLVIIMWVLKVGVVMVPPIFLLDILDNAIPSGKVGLVIFDAFIVLLFTIIESVINYLNSVIYSNLYNKSYTYYQNRCLGHLFKMPGKYYSEMSSGEVFATTNQDVGQIQTLLSGTLFDFVSDCLTAIVMFFFLLYIQWDLLLSILIVMPIVFFVQNHYQRLGRKKAEELRENVSGLISLLQNIISSIISFLYSGARTYFEGKYNKKLDSFLDEQKRLRLVFSKNSGILNFLATFLDIIVLGYGGAKVIMETLSFGGLVTFKTYTSKLVVPMLRVSGVLIELQSTVVSLKKVYDFLDLPIIEDNGTLNKGLAEANNINISDVSFVYDEKKNLLDHVDCKFENSRFNVLIGESGCGKSTILSLLFRLWKTKSGTIQINDINIEQFDVDYLRQNVAIVSQDMYLFDDTIRNNIALNSNSSLEEIREVVQMACIDKYIDSLPEGYDTIVGERGIRLSGGEKQRICLARALLRNTPILILDEATSALDQMTEKRVLSNLSKKIENRIVVIITHRLQAVVDSDCIYVIKDGRVLAKGTHDELMASNAYYKNLYERKIDL